MMYAPPASNFKSNTVTVWNWDISCVFIMWWHLYEQKVKPLLWDFADNLFVVVEQPVVLTPDPAALWPVGRQLHPRVREKGCHNRNIQNTGRKGTIRAGVANAGSKPPHELRVSGYRIHNPSAGKVWIDATGWRGESGLRAQLCQRFLGASDVCSEVSNDWLSLQFYQ